MVSHFVAAESLANPYFSHFLPSHPALSRISQLSCLFTTVIGLQLGVLLAGSIVTEVIFSINGVGKYLVDSMNARDYAAVQGCVLLIAFVSAILNLIVDIIYTFIDPRMKTMYESSKSGFFRFKKRGEKKAA